MNPVFNARDADKIRNDFPLKKVTFANDEKAKIRDCNVPCDENAPVKRKNGEKEEFRVLSIHRNPFTKSPEQKRELARARARELCIMHELGENRPSTDRNIHGMKLQANLSANPFAEISTDGYGANLSIENYVQGSQETHHKINSKNSPQCNHRSSKMSTIHEDDSPVEKSLLVHEHLCHLHRYDLPHFC